MEAESKNRNINFIVTYFTNETTEIFVAVQLRTLALLGCQQVTGSQCFE
jgi:hypothetical protein